MTVREIVRRFQGLGRRDRLSGELHDEMRLHIELRARRLQERGLAFEEAGYKARRQFGDLASYQDRISDMWGWSMWERLLQDLHYGARSLRKAPGFTALAVLTLALGLGMNVAMFSIVNSVMIRSLPFPQPDRLLALWEQNIKTGERTTVTVANLDDYRSAGEIEKLAAYTVTPMNLTGGNTPERLLGESVTWNFFTALGIAPARGRTFLPEEDRPNANGVVIVTDRFRKRHFGGEGDVLGRSILLDSRPYRIVGVLPARFQSPAQMGITDRIEFYVPAAYSQELLSSRGDHEVRALLRLRPGASFATARAQLDAISDNIAKRFPAASGNIRVRIAPLRSDIVRQVSPAMLALLGASGLILLIACVNLANLLLIRAIRRGHESSVRIALGASRVRIARQCLVESLLIASAGCAAGLVLGSLLMRAMIALAPPQTPRIHDIAMDWTVFGIAAAIATLCGILIGLSPAWQTSQAKPVAALRSGARGTGGKSQTRWRSALTLAEVALSLILLVGAGLLLRSFVLLVGVDLGFHPDHVAAMNINLPILRYATPLSRLQFFERLEERARALPGVRGVAYTNNLPLRGAWGSGISLDTSPDTLVVPDFQAVSPGYFETLGISLAGGRLLNASDRDGAPAVAVVNHAFSRQYLGSQDPIGHRLRRGPKQPWLTIVGVVNDIRRAGKTDVLNPEVYLSAAQTQVYPVRLADFAVRTSGDPLALVDAIQQQVLAIDRDQPITNVRTMQQIVDRDVAERRFETLLLMAFAAVTVLLAMTGIYGVLAYAVAQRMQELGLRIALGAAPRAVVTLVLRQAALLIACGLVAGVLASLVATRYLQTLLFQVKPYDWSTYIAAAALLAASGIAAAFIPALRGSRVDPAIALRAE